MGLGAVVGPVALVVLVLAALLSAVLIGISEKVRVEAWRADVTALTTNHANAVQRNVARALSATFPLAALIRQGDGEVADFDTIAAEMLPFYEGASALALAPGGVVRQIVPLAGNEGAIGHDLLKDPERDKEAIKARDSGVMTLAGPFTLVQGGDAAAGRLPVYLESPGGGRSFWGFVSVLIRFPETLGPAKLPELAARGYAYQLWRTHPDSGERHVIAASDEKALVEPVAYSFRVPNATWTLSVAPQQGWVKPGELFLKVLAGALASIMLAMLAGALKRLQGQQLELEGRVRERTDELARSEQKLMSILEGVEAYIYIKDPQGRYQFANRPVRDLFGRSMEEILGQDDAPFFDADTYARIREIDQRVLLEGETVRVEEENLTHDGSSRTYWSVKLPLRADDGTIYALCGISTDISERKQAERQIASSEARYRALFADNSVVMLLVDPANGRIVDGNHAAAAYYRCDLDSLKARGIAEMAEQSPEQAERSLAHALEKCGEAGESQHRLADGELRDVLVSSAPIELEGRTLLLFSVQDITEQKQATRSLRESELRFRSLFESVDNVAVQGYDHAHNVIFWNRASESLYGYRQEEAMGQPLEELIIPPGARDGVRRMIDALIDEGTPIPAGEMVYRTKYGGKAPVYSSYSMQVRSDGAPEFYRIDVDLRERYEAEARMREALAVFNASSQGIMTTDTSGVIAMVNPAFTRITGYEADEVIGRNPSILNSGRHDAAFYAGMWSALLGVGHWEGEIWNRRKNGEIYPQWLSISVVRDPDGEVSEYVALFSDITERKQHEEVIWRQANFDGLTGLANRSLLGDRLERALAQARRHETKVGLIFIDLDGFKWINDTLGHDVGDELLIEAARRLQECVRAEDTVARLGGDEFTVVVQRVTDAESLHNIAEKVVAAMREPFDLGGRSQRLSASVGITVYPEDGKDVQSLLKNADIAMYKAKQAGKNRYQFYAHHMQVDAQARMQMEIDLRAALERDEFSLHYQPIISLASGELVGAEALLRWEHPERGNVPPFEFVPVAEDCGLVVPIGEWVLRAAARQWSEWHRSGLPSLHLSVNVSSVQFRERNLSTLMAEVLAEHGVDPGRLILEITESVLMDGSREAESRMREIKSQGVAYALDDFGTGYSSLSYLKRFPVDIVKIDRSFVNDCPNDSSDAHLVEAIITMAHSLDLEVTAEGVETEEQLEFLRALGCDYVQGYLLGQPVPARDFELMLGESRLGSATRAG